MPRSIERTARGRALVLAVVGMTGLAHVPARAQDAVCDSLEQRIVPGVAAPRPEAPRILAEGEPLTLYLVSATGFTPPPGLQEARAHRALAVRLCAEGEALGAPAEQCTPLRVEDVRPCSAHSLAYRVRVSVEPWLSQGPHTLKVRFPGGETALPGAVCIGRCTGRRLHVGPAGLRELPVQGRITPRPTGDGDFGGGYVVSLPPGEAVNASVRSQREPMPVVLETNAARAMEWVRVSLPGLPPGSRVFVRSAAGDLATGGDLRLPARSVGRLALSALVVGPDGRMGQASTSVEIRPLVGFGCALGGEGHVSPALGLLGLALSATLRRRMRGADPARRGGRPDGGGNTP